MTEMANDTTVTFKTDKKVKDASRKLFAELGLDMSSAINIFLRQCLKEEGIPFAISRKPNPVTLQTIREAEQGINMHGPFDSYDDMMEDLLHEEDQ